jgi:hypothetical protein
MESPDVSSTTVVLAPSSASFFTNDYWWECGLINDCKIKEQGCVNDYTGDHLTIDAVTGEITARQDVVLGYNDTVCIECANTAGSIITYDNWNAEQYSSCTVN